MGYDTNYSLYLYNEEQNPLWESAPEIEDKIIQRLKDLQIITYALDVDLGSSDRVKWYEHEDDMIALSKEFPEVIFCLHGEGEESGDLWSKYFKNGKMQECRAKIIYDPYDEKQLE